MAPSQTAAWLCPSPRSSSRTQTRETSSRKPLLPGRRCAVCLRSGLRPLRSVINGLSCWHSKRAAQSADEGLEWLLPLPAQQPCLRETALVGERSDAAMVVAQTRLP